MSAASVAEPFLLSSYPESSKYRKRRAVSLLASLPSGSDTDPYVSVAVQGDGIHVLDTSTLHPAVSHTLGPTVSFSCSPATRTSHTKGGARACTTYAVLESGPDVQPEGKGKTIAAWEENLLGVISSEVQSEKKKRTALAPHPVAHIYALDYMPGHVVLVGAAGEVSIASEELLVLHTQTPQNHPSSALRKHFLYHAALCSFLPLQTTSAYSAVSVSFLRSGDALNLSVVGLEGRNVSSLGECLVPVEETEILDISCSTSGFISVLLPSGTWLSFSLSSSPSSTLSVSSTADPLRLQGLTFINTTRTSEVSLAALTSSHVLLSAVTSGSPVEILLLIWDLRYGVLLAQQTLSVPSTLPRPKTHGAILQLDVSSIPPTASSTSKSSTVQLNAILTLLPHPEREMLPESGGAPARSTILVAPLTVAANSTIAAAMGKANAGARWVSTKLGPQAQGQNARGLPEFSAAARKILQEMKTAMNGSANGSTAAAETVFFEYEYVKRQRTSKGADGEEHTPLEYPFVQGVLEIVLRAPAGTQGTSASGKGQGLGAYSPKIVRHLLDNRAANSSMVEGGLLPALAARSDWDMMALAMRAVSDLPENDILALLSQVVAAHRRSLTATDENAMHIDAVPPASASIPTLPAFLTRCITYPATPAQQRIALRKHLSDAADISLVLEVLDGWIVRHTENDDDALLAFSDTADSVPDIPPLDKILTFVQTLLDASFLALLAHAPAHHLLRSLSAHIEPAIAHTKELELLCGPLEPFARAAAAKAKAQAEAKEGANPDSGRDWRRKRKLVHEQAGMAIGLYQVEELVL